jgi:hypothetical protein
MEYYTVDPYIGSGPPTYLAHEYRLDTTCILSRVTDNPLESCHWQSEDCVFSRRINYTDTGWSDWSSVSAIVTLYLTTDVYPLCKWAIEFRFGNLEFPNPIYTGYANKHVGNSPNDGNSYYGEWTYTNFGAKKTISWATVS